MRWLIRTGRTSATSTSTREFPSLILSHSLLRALSRVLAGSQGERLPEHPGQGTACATMW